ncbi:MAG TPA: sulfotransferase [Steroidobacteraceae bacterium]|nr:sulfotransferase [Steroidobacteraceae bacterium]
MPSPSDPELLLEPARQDLASGRLDAAEAKCLQVLGAHYHHPSALQVLGQVLHSQARHDEAVRVFNALTVMEPTVAGHWQNLACVLRPAKRYAEALAAFEKALQLAPPSAALLYNLGVLQMDRCDYRAAYLALRDAVGLAPADATTRWAFAQCCYDIVQLDEARAALRDWQRLDGLSVEISARIALLLVMLGAAREATPLIERLLADPPRSGRTALVLVSTLERLQRLDEARAITQWIELNDRSHDADPERLMLSGILADRAGQHEEAYRYLSLALQHHKEFARRHHVLFPFAKTCDSLGRYDEAYSAAEEAHSSRRAFLELATGSSSAEESPLLARTANGCDPDDVAAWEEAGPAMEDSPLFIVGFPRSGTTLLEQVLDAHPRLVSMDEQPFMSKALETVTGSGIRYPSELGKLTEHALGDIRARYWDLARNKAALLPGQRLVDKFPMNMTLLPLIRRVFPNARIVLAIRHPCDTLLSCFLQNFRAPELALLCRDLSTLASAYSRIFGYWYAQWPLLQPFSYELRYEKLTADFEAEVRKLAAFLQLPWNEAMLAPAEHARAKGFISTPSYTQVVEPVHSKSVGRWMHYERHFSKVLPILMPWLERWGYALS